VSASRRFHLLLPVELEAEAKAFGRGAGLGLGAAIRMLVARGLEAGSNPACSTTELALLATLTAAEHGVLMVASILPEGDRRMRELGQRAMLAAEERLALFTAEREGDR
jgi:hypothetical protein